MKFTGERVIPGEVDADLFNEHWTRYLFAQQLVGGKKVLDAACGSGYGSALLAETAREVTGIDISPEAIAYAQDHYGEKAAFTRADCLALPFAGGLFDVIAAFEIVEHLKDPDGFLRELRRVLAPEGVLLLSTPNRLYYTEDRGEVNPFHEREYSYPEFAALLGNAFPFYAVFLQDHVEGLLVSDAAGPSSPSIAAAIAAPSASGQRCAEQRQREAYFMIAVASANPLPPIRPLLYLPSTANILREREMHVRQLEQQLAEAQQERDTARQHVHQRETELEDRTRWAKDLEQQMEERTRWGQQLDRELSEKNAALRELQADHEEKVKWALSLQQEIETARAALSKLQQEFEDRTAWAVRLDADVKERTEWAQRLDAELKLRSEELRMVYGSRWYRIGKKLRLSPVPPSDQGSKKD